MCLVPLSKKECLKTISYIKIKQSLEKYSSKKQKTKQQKRRKYCYQFLFSLDVSLLLDFIFGLDEIGDHFALSLDQDLASTLTLIASIVHQYLGRFVCYLKTQFSYNLKFHCASLKFHAYLNSIHDTTALHPRRHINRIAPNVILWLGRSNNSGNNGSNIDANTQLEVIEAVLVY